MSQPVAQSARTHAVQTKHQVQHPIVEICRMEPVSGNTTQRVLRCRLLSDVSSCRRTADRLKLP